MNKFSKHTCKKQNRFFFFFLFLFLKKMQHSISALGKGGGIKIFWSLSHEKSEDICDNVESTCLVLSNIEGLGESEFIAVIHLEGTED